MHIAYLSSHQPLAQAGKWSLLISSTVAQAWDWQDELMRYQAIYEELLASPDWAIQATPPSPAPRQRLPSVRDLTRDLAGWSLPQPGQRPVAKS